MRVVQEKRTKIHLLEQGKVERGSGLKWWWRLSKFGGLQEGEKEILITVRAQIDADDDSAINEIKHQD